MSWESGQTFRESLACAKSGQEESAYVESPCCTLQCYMRGFEGRAGVGDGQGWSPRVDGMDRRPLLRVDVAPSVHSRDKDGPAIVLSMYTG